MSDLSDHEARTRAVYYAGGWRDDAPGDGALGSTKGKRQMRTELEKERGESLAATGHFGRLRLYACAIGDLAEHVEPNSVDVIITDPPYPEVFLPVYSDLSSFAEHALKPGGSLLVLCGQSHLAEYLRRLGESLRYHWTLAYLTPGGENVQIWSRKLNTFWKPVLWFTKGAYAGEWHGDTIRSLVTPDIKEHHVWGQTERGMAALVEGWSKPGEVVCDPFLGGGTTAVVALDLGRRFIGADLDPEALETTQARLREDLP